MDTLTHSEIEQQLQQIDPYEFEKVVAEVWKLQGYDTTVRQGSGDRGVDVEAIKKKPVDQKVLIQVKRYTNQNKVGSEEVRKYATLYQQVPDTDTVVIVTTGDFTSEAETLASDLGVKIIDGPGISEIVSQNIDKFRDYFRRDTDTESVTDGKENSRPEEEKSNDKKDNIEKLRNRLNQAINEEGMLGERGRAKVSWRTKSGVHHDLDIFYKKKGTLFRKFGAMLSLYPQIDRGRQHEKFHTIQSYPEVSKISNKHGATMIWVPKESDSDIETDIQLLTTLIQDTGGRMDNVTVHTFSNS